MGGGKTEGTKETKFVNDEQKQKKTAGQLETERGEGRERNGRG